MMINKNAQIKNIFPESWMLKSDKQRQLEKQGCVFMGQEALNNHELDINKPCYCKRPNK